VQRGRAERLGRGDVDDARAFRFSQMGQRRADDARMRRQHHRERLAPCLVIGRVVDRQTHGDAGIVDDDVERAEMRGDLVDDSADRLGIGDVEPPRFRTAADRGDFICDGLRSVRAHIGHRDIGAFGREHACCGAAHAAGCARDEHRQSLHRAAELLEFGHRGFLLQSIDKRHSHPKTRQTSGGRAMNEFDFGNKQVLVVGGSSGIGNGIAQAFRAHGARVSVCGTRAAAADYSAEEGSHLDGLDYLSVCPGRS
jgi:hypothetical protein